MNQFDETSFTKNAVLRIGGLHSSVTSDNLRDNFIPFGPITKIAVPIDEKAQQEGQPLKNRGFAFIEFQDPDDADHAMKNMNDADFFGGILRVSIAQPNSQKKGQWDIVNETPSNESEMRDD